MNFDDLIKIKDCQMMMCRALDGAPRNTTWRGVSNWVEKMYTIDQIILIMRRIYLELDEKCNTELDDDRLDWIRDNSDVFWHALPDTHDWNKEIAKWLEEIGKEN